jgi:WhiB family redox-sensing transcriptional regulator
MGEDAEGRHMVNVANITIERGSQDGARRRGQLTPSITSPAEGRTVWVSKARCRSADPDQLFVRGAAQKKAAAICRHCPVVAECAAEALDNQMEFGVWGGMTERQRRALLKQHPEVNSWAEFFAAKRERRDAS